MSKTLVAAAVLTLVMTQSQAATPLSERFLQNEAHSSTYELAVAHLAQTRATRPEVRAYAGTLVNDQEAYTAALHDLARSKGVAVSWRMTARGQQQLDRLTAIRGAAFDDSFVREAQRINAEDVRKLRREASITPDPDIRNFVGHFIKDEEKREAGARALSGHTVASRMPVLAPPPTGNKMPVIKPPDDRVMPVIPPPVQPQK